MKYKKIAITGVAGFIGSHFTRMCLSLGYDVVGIDKLTYAADVNHVNEFKKHPNFKFIQVDINDINFNKLFLSDREIIINFAAESHVDNSINNCKEFIHSNVYGVVEILNLCRELHIPLLHIGTDEEYGDIEEGSHTEEDILNPSNPYAASKAAASLFIQSFARTYKTKYQIIRMTNNYGIEQHPEKLIPKAIGCLFRGESIPLHNDGNPKRNWLNVFDSVEGILTVLEHGNMNEIYNMNGNCELKNITTVNQIINEYFNYRLPKPSMEYCDFSFSRPGQDIRYSLNDDKLRNLGWSPKIEFDEALKTIVSYERTKLNNKV